MCVGGVSKSKLIVYYDSLLIKSPNLLEKQVTL